MVFAKFVALAAALMLAFSALPAAQAKGKGKHGGGKSWKHSSSTKPERWSRGKRKGWNGQRVPPGWSKGRKRGWGSYSMPPGLRIRF
jgi:hypothetical protein